MSSRKILQEIKFSKIGKFVEHEKKNIWNDEKVPYGKIMAFKTQNDESFRWRSSAPVNDVMMSAIEAIAKWISYVVTKLSRKLPENTQRAT